MANDIAPETLLVDPVILLDTVTSTLPEGGTVSCTLGPPRSV
jgi:hypothetical protein